MEGTRETATMAVSVGAGVISTRILLVMPGP
jgi:hypothetical protein